MMSKKYLNPTSSDKPQQPLSDDLISQCIDIDEGGYIQIYKPVIDKICILIDSVPAPGAEAFIKEYVSHPIPDEDDWMSHTGNNAGLKKYYYYAIACKSDDAPDDPIILQAVPKNDDAPFLRLEFSPARLGKSNLNDALGNLDEAIFDKFIKIKDLIAKGRVSRIDVAVDMVGVRPADLIVNYLHPAKMHEYQGADGWPQTSYYGLGLSFKTSKKSGDITVYDKRHVNFHEGKPLLGDGAPHTRIECHFRKQMKFSELGNMASPLGKIHVRAMRVEKLAGTPPEYRWFLEACRSRGLARVLDGFDQSSKMHWLGIYNAYSQDIWEPEVLWKDWLEILQSTGLLK